VGRGWSFRAAVAGGVSAPRVVCSSLPPPGRRSQGFSGCREAFAVVDDTR
jgi:hypothetical protein